MFVVPEPHIVKETAKIYDLQDPTSKMSKSAASDAGLINLLDDAEGVGEEDQVRGHRHRPRGRLRPGEQAGRQQPADHLLGALTGESTAALEERYAGKMYGHLKVDVADALGEFVFPFQQKVETYLSDEAGLDRILATGADRARAVAGPTLAQVYDRVGFLAAKG